MKYRGYDEEKLKSVPYAYHRKHCRKLISDPHTLITGFYHLCVFYSGLQDPTTDSVQPFFKSNWQALFKKEMNYIAKGHLSDLPGVDYYVLTESPCTFPYSSTAACATVGSECSCDGRRIYRYSGRHRSGRPSAGHRFARPQPVTDSPDPQASTNSPVQQARGAQRAKKKRRRDEMTPEEKEQYNKKRRQERKRETTEQKERRKLRDKQRKEKRKETDKEQFV